MQNDLSFLKVAPPLSGAVRKRKREHNEVDPSPIPNSSRHDEIVEVDESHLETEWNVEETEYESMGDKIEVHFPIADQMVSKSPTSKIDRDSLELFPKIEKPSSPITGVGSKKDVRSSTVLKSAKDSAYTAKLNETYRASARMLGLQFRFALTADEKMKIRRYRIKIDGNKPIIPVRNTKSAELKEAFSSYCGRPIRLKNWLYEV